MIPKLVMLAFLYTCLVGFRGTFFQITGAMRSSYVPSPIVVESWVLLICLCIELTFRLADYMDRPSSPCINHCSETANLGWIFPAGSGSCWCSPLVLPFVWVMNWSPPLVVFFLGPLGLVTSADQCQMFCVTGLRLCIWSYHIIHCLPAASAGSECVCVCVRGQDWLPAVLS